MPPAVSFLLLSILMTLSTATARNTTTRDAARRARIAAKRIAAPAVRDNLRIALDYVRSERDSPLVSLVSADVRAEYVDLVSEYVANEPIVSYRITTGELTSRARGWQERADLTWILVVDDADALDALVNGHRRIWKAGNQYVIIVTARHIAALPRELFRDAWLNHSVHMLVAITVREEFRCLSRYLPFERDHARSEYGVVRKICPTASDDGGDAAGVRLYDGFARLNGYPIRVVVFSSLMMDIQRDRSNKSVTYEKLDANAMSLLEKTMGARFRVKIIDHFGKQKDPFILTLRDIESGYSEMVITSFFVHKYKNFRLHEFTVGLYEDKLCLIAPAARFVPKSYMPIMPFTLDLWAVLAIYNLVISVLWFLIKYYSEAFRRRDYVLLLPLARTPPPPPPSSSSPPPRVHPYVSSCFDLAEVWCYPLQENGAGTAAQRALLSGTLFFGLIVTGLYQSYLVSSLSKPFRYPELNTLKDVADSNYTILTKYYNLQQDTFTENTTVTNRLRSKFELFSFAESTTDMVACGKNVALRRYSSIMMDNLSKYYDEDGNELLHIVEECSSTYLLSYVVRLHSPYRERMNELLLRIQAAGLIDLWYSDMKYPTYVDKQRRRVAKVDRRYRLTMEHYSLTFLGLSLGLLAGVAVFLAELYFARRAAGRPDDLGKGLAARALLPHYYALVRQLREEFAISRDNNRND